MFPLGSVLFPTMVMPLHIFEPRYRSLVRDVLAGDRRFGVCLIERGSEVGGGEQRLPVGTVAEIREAAELPDGRWALLTVGVQRIRVQTWLDDDPYPRADVVDFADPPASRPQLALASEVASELRRAHDRAQRLGAVVPESAPLSDNPVLASYQLATQAPVSTLDQYALLAASTVGLRLAALASALQDVHAELDLREAENPE